MNKSRSTKNDFNNSKAADWVARKLFINLFNKVVGILGKEKAIYWMNCENPYLGNKKPISLCAMGRGHKVEQLVDTMIEENKNE
jgi:hypothetical protein